MHEFGIVRGIVEVALEAAQREGAVRVNEVHVRVGDLTTIVDEAMEFAFAALIPGTIAEGGRLVIERVPAMSQCAACGVEFSHGHYDVACPACGSLGCAPLAGRELEVVSIDIDLPEQEDTRQ